MRKMPNIQQVAKAVPNIQQVPSSTRAIPQSQQEGNARHLEQEAGQQGANAQVQSDWKDSKEATRASQQMDRALGNHCQAYSCSRGSARQAKGQDFCRTMPCSQQVVRI